MSDQTPETQEQAPQDTQGGVSEEQAGQEHDEQHDDESTTDVEKLRASAQKARREARNLRERFKESEKELQEFRAWKESQKTEEQKRTEEYERALARNAELERDVWTRDIAAEHELPASAVKFLPGSSREELAESAKELKALLNKPSADRTNPGQNRFGSGNSKEALANDFFSAGSY